MREAELQKLGMLPYAAGEERAPKDSYHVSFQLEVVARCSRRAATLPVPNAADTKLDKLVSDEHFSVDGRLPEARILHKNFCPRDGDDKCDGGDPPRRTARQRDSYLGAGSGCLFDAQKQGPCSELSYLANALMENRNGLLADIDVRVATGMGERVRKAAKASRHQAERCPLRERWAQRDRWATARGNDYAVISQVRKRTEQVSTGFKRATICAGYSGLDWRRCAHG